MPLVTNPKGVAPSRSPSDRSAQSRPCGLSPYAVAIIALTRRDRQSGAAADICGGNDGGRGVGYPSGSGSIYCSLSIVAQALMMPRTTGELVVNRNVRPVGLICPNRQASTVVSA